MNELIACLTGLLHSYLISPSCGKRAMDANGPAGKNQRDLQRRIIDTQMDDGQDLGSVVIAFAETAERR